MFFKADCKRCFICNKRSIIGMYDKPSHALHYWHKRVAVDGYVCCQ
jgi:hypothetical protein